MAKTWKLVTEAEVVEWRKLEAEGLSLREISERTGRGHQTIADYLSGKRVPRRRLISGTPQPDVPETCFKCGKRGTAAMPLQRNADENDRCVECAARWQARAEGKAK